MGQFFEGKKELTAKAFFLGQRLDLRAFEQSKRLASNPLMATAGSCGAAVLFRYGVAVLIGLTDVEEAAFLLDIRPMITEPFDSPESEEVYIVKDENISEGTTTPGVSLHSFSIDRLRLLSDALAKSVVLAHYEARLAGTFDRIEPLAIDLQQGKRTSGSSRELLRHIGDALSIQGKMVGRVEVAEKPDMLWDNPELGRLYMRLEDEYEIDERHRALERKLDLISRTAETLLGILQAKRSLRVEWYIVILIVFEIIISLYSKFFG